MLLLYGLLSHISKPGLQPTHIPRLLACIAYSQGAFEASAVSLVIMSFRFIGLRIA